MKQGNPPPTQADIDKGERVRVIRAVEAGRLAQRMVYGSPGTQDTLDRLVSFVTNYLNSHCREQYRIIGQFVPQMDVINLNFLFFTKFPPMMHELQIPREYIEDGMWTQIEDMVHGVLLESNVE